MRRAELTCALWIWLAILGVLIGCESGPIALGRLAVVKVVSCRQLSSAELTERVPYWERAIRESFEPPTMNESWDSLVREMLRVHPGVLLKISVDEQATIDLHRAWGNPTKITVDKWAASGKEESAFASEFEHSCESYRELETWTVLLRYNSGGTFIPAHPAEFLGIPSLERVPRLLEPFVPHDRLASQGDSRSG